MNGHPFWSPLSGAVGGAVSGIIGMIIIIASFLMWGWTAAWIVYAAIVIYGVTAVVVSIVKIERE